MNLTFVGHRCCDHSPSSGYDQVCSLFPEAGWLDGRALEAGRLEWLRAPKEFSEVPIRIFHVFYGDCSGKALPAILRERFPGSVIVSSAHQPVSQLQADGLAMAALRASDAIVTVSRRQARELADVGLAVPVYAIPHGVWIGTFRPAAATTDRPRSDIVIIGSFLRDWDGAKQIAARLAQAGVRPRALGAGPRDHLRGEQLPIDVLPRVSEKELATIYDRAAAVLVPFLEATASNALLEAMAAGCPVVCPRLPSLVEEYLGDEVDTYERGRYDVAADRLLYYLRNPGARDVRSRELMARVEPFDWARLKPRYSATYEEVVANSLVTWSNRLSMAVGD